VAVPTGEYELRTSIDLSPLFGEVKGEARLRIEQPGPDALAKHLARIEAVKAGDRFKIIGELVYFEDSGDRVVPALVEIISRSDGPDRISAIFVLEDFPDHARLAKEALLSLLSLHGNYDDPGSFAAAVLGRLYPRISLLADAYQGACYRDQNGLVLKAATAIRRYFAQETPSDD
jgi:hypothetical protein